MLNILDNTDFKIVKLLQQDGRIPVTEIAKKIGVTEGSIRKRMNILLKEKVIQVVAIGNFYNLGHGVSGFLIIHAELKENKPIIKQLRDIPEIWMVSTIMGSTGNICAAFYVSSFKKYNRLLEQVTHIEGIQKIEQNLHTEFFKEDYKWKFMDESLNPD